MGDSCELYKIQMLLKRKMKRETRKTRVKEVGKPHKVTIVLKLMGKKDKTITRERGILTRSIKRLVTPQREEYDISTKERKRGYNRSHQIHQVQWRL